MGAAIQTRELRGLLAGVVGTLALTAFERLEWAALGRVAMYAPAPIGRRLARRWLATGPSDETAYLGYALRWLYGPSLGIVFGWLRRPTRHPVTAGLWFGAGILVFEGIVMPALAATPPLRTWPRRELALLWLHTTVFGVTAAFAFKMLTPRGMR